MTFFLKNGELFAELGGGAGVVSVVGTEGATLLQAAVEGRIPEDLSVFGNRVRYLEVKRTAEWPESAAVSLGEEGYQPAVRFLGNMFFNVEGSTVKTSLDDEHYGFYAPRGLYCIPCIKFLDNDTLDGNGPGGPQGRAPLSAGPLRALPGGPVGPVPAAPRLRRGGVWGAGRRPDERGPEAVAGADERCPPRLKNTGPCFSAIAANL